MLFKLLILISKTFQKSSRSINLLLQFFVVLNSILISFGVLVQLFLLSLNIIFTSCKSFTGSLNHFISLIHCINSIFPLLNKVLSFFMECFVIFSGFFQFYLN